MVNLKDGSLHGYWVLTRIVSGGIEIGFNDIINKETKAEVENMVLRAVASRILDKPLFIRIPISRELSYLPALSKNFVLRIPSDVSMKQLGEIMTVVRKGGLRTALDDYRTTGYELKEIRIGSFDYVFFNEDFYTNAKRSDIERIIASFKLFKTKVGFKNIDSEKKLKLAQSIDVDLATGYLFGSESLPAGRIE
ncbi:MAG: diguanylate phosphodiesterase [Aquificaceae bacterium]